MKGNHNVRQLFLGKKMNKDIYIRERSGILSNLNEVSPNQNDVFSAELVHSSWKLQWL